MKIDEIAKAVDAKILTGQNQIQKEVAYAFASDLMSDVLTVSKDRLLLITGLANIQAIRTAEMADISVIIFVRNKQVSQEIINLAEENNIVVMTCSGSMFKTSGQLFMAGLKPLF